MDRLVMLLNDNPAIQEVLFADAPGEVGLRGRSAHPRIAHWLHAGWGQNNLMTSVPQSARCTIP